MDIFLLGKEKTSGRAMHFKTKETGKITQIFNGKSSGKVGDEGSDHGGAGPSDNHVIDIDKNIESETRLNIDKERRV